MKIPFRKIHRYTGIISALFLLTVLTTGIALQHPEWFSSTSINTPLTHRLNYENSIYFGTSKGLYYKKTIASPLSKLPLRFQQSRVVGLLVYKNKLTIAYKDALLLQFEHGLWTNIELPEHTHIIYSISKLDKQLQICTNHGIYSQTDDGNWILLEEQPQEDDVLHMIKTIHTGYFFGDSMVELYHFGAWVTLLLIFSGIGVFFWRRI